MVLNPTAVVITVSPPDNVEYFRLVYYFAGEPVATLVQDANYVTNADFSQNLAPLNALVPAQAQGENLSLGIRAGNSGGESAQFGAATDIQVESAPAQPSNAVVS